MTPFRPLRTAVLGIGLLVSGFTAERLADLRLSADLVVDARSEAVDVVAKTAPVGGGTKVVLDSDAALPPVQPVSLGARLPMGPVQGPVSSPFGWRRHPVSGQVRHHGGVDLAVPAGTAVWTVAPGRVRAVGRRGGYGLVVEIDHATGLGRRPVRTLYAHLSAVDATLRPGSRVALGQAIAASGGTPGRDGVSTGAHLHFEILDSSGEPLDPGRFVRLLDTVRASDRAPQLASQPFAPRAAALVAPRAGQPAAAPRAPRDMVDIWPAAAPDLPRAERLPEVVLPSYPATSGGGHVPHAPVSSASPNPS